MAKKRKKKTETKEGRTKGTFMSPPANSPSVMILSVRKLPFSKEFLELKRKKLSSKGPKINSTLMPTKGRKERGKEETLSFLVKSTNGAAFRTIPNDWRFV